MKICQSELLELPYVYVEIEHFIDNILRVINKNGGFMIIGQYKRSNIFDCYIFRKLIMKNQKET